MSSCIKIPADILFSECDYGLKKILEARKKYVKEWLEEATVRINRHRWFRKKLSIKDVESLLKTKEEKEKEKDIGKFMAEIAHWENFKDILRLKQLAQNAKSISVVASDDTYKDVVVSGEDLRTLRKWTGSK